MGNTNKKILVVEDDTAISVMYKGKFESDGFQVLTVDNGADAVDIAKKEKPDLILLDIIIPRMDGFSVLEALKQDTGTKKIPVIMLTNLGTEEDKAKGEKLGAVDYVVKANFTPVQISDVIKKHLK